MERFHHQPGILSNSLLWSFSDPNSAEDCLGCHADGENARYVTYILTSKDENINLIKLILTYIIIIGYLVGDYDIY